ncbi:hypothetical protein H9Q09_10300 [Aurantimonas sp. DM33-3]|uniref:DUF6634 family protein n=1 Tax=Aurantimonas sp. DM33-3 TaxID=2766955 RepID=UPI001652871E|nr:DUF6634 family protein [Aurantimonas sp. DM33-3]MBC6716596.1 hypothetical protein [Aurantimonas sp. DM33-3]
MSRTPMTARERADVRRTLARYESLCSDLRETLQHGWPSPDLLESMGAPLIDLYRFGTRGVVNMEGEVGDHPLLGTGWTKTSPLLALSVRAGVGRTQSRWYRLGTPLQSVADALGARIVEGSK